jgi:hypothetical protein
VDGGWERSFFNSTYTFSLFVLYRFPNYIALSLFNIFFQRKEKIKKNKKKKKEK